MDNQDQLINWVSKISEKQSFSSTSITELKSRNEEQSKKYTATKKAKGTSERLQRINKISEMTSYSGLAQMTSVRAPAPAPSRNIFSNFLGNNNTHDTTNTNQQLYTTVSEAQTTRSKALMDVVGKTSRNMQNQAQYNDQFNAEEDEAADDRNLDELERTLALEVQAILPSPASAPAPTSATQAQPTTTNPANTAGDDNTYDIASLLKELYTEPSDPDELVSKFNLYENFLNTVTAIRDITLTFWSQNSDLFPIGIIRSRLQREIDHIDSPTNLHGSEENDGRWFVCGMVERAAKNSRMISNILNSMKLLLEKLVKGVYNIY